MTVNSRASAYPPHPPSPPPRRPPGFDQVSPNEQTIFYNQTNEHQAHHQLPAEATATQPDHPTSHPQPPNHPTTNNTKHSLATEQLNSDPTIEHRTTNSPIAGLCATFQTFTGRSAKTGYCTHTLAARRSRRTDLACMEQSKAFAPPRVQTVLCSQPCSL